MKIQIPPTRFSTPTRPQAQVVKAEDLADQDQAAYADEFANTSTPGPHWGGVLPGAIFGAALGGLGCVGGSNLAKSALIEAGAMGAAGALYGLSTSSALSASIGGAAHCIVGWALGQAMGGSVVARIAGDAIVGAVAGAFLFSDD